MTPVSRRVTPGGRDSIQFNDEHDSAGRLAFNTTTRPVLQQHHHSSIFRALPQKKARPSTAGKDSINFQDDKPLAKKERIRCPPGGKDSIDLSTDSQAIPLRVHGKRPPPGGKDSVVFDDSQKAIPLPKNSKRFPPGGKETIDPPPSIHRSRKGGDYPPGGTDHIDFQEEPGGKAKIHGLSERTRGPPGGKDSIVFGDSIPVAPMSATGKRYYAGKGSIDFGGTSIPATALQRTHRPTHRATQDSCGPVMHGSGAAPGPLRREKAGGLTPRTSMEALLGEESAATQRRPRSQGSARASSMGNILAQQPPTSSGVRVRYAQGAQTFSFD